MARCPNHSKGCKPVLLNSPELLRYIIQNFFPFSILCIYYKWFWLVCQELFWVWLQNFDVWSLRIKKTPRDGGVQKTRLFVWFRFVTRWGLIAKACASRVHKIKKLLSMEFAPTSFLSRRRYHPTMNASMVFALSSNRLVFAGYTGVTIPSQFTSVYKLHFALLGYLLWDFCDRL